MRAALYNGPASLSFSEQGRPAWTSMVMPRLARVALALCLLSASSAVPLAHGPDATTLLASLAGTWARNVGLSDDPAEAVKEHRVHPPFIGPAAPGAPIGSGGMGGPIMGGRGGYRPDPAEVERTRALMHLVTDGPDELMISVDGLAVTITSRTGRVQHLKADGAKVLEDSEAGVALERRTKWDDGALVTSFKVKGGGGDGKQVYKRSGARLTLQVVFDGDAALHTVKVKHVYDLKPAP
jgi:hypothetical protein